ncbi:MAG TPA: hypothetical protein VFI68_00520, partial [Anaerolineales bacterium]|nr:hypothetical protein [Anaerolineales bacterium]
MKRKVFIRLAVIAGGIGIVLLSVFAFQLGLDNDPGWGPRRIQLIGAGLVIILFGSLYWITPAISRLLKFPVSPSSSPTVPENTNSNGKSINIWLILLGCFVLWLYIWIITFGKIEVWPSGRDYYWKLSQAFRQGQTHLLVVPPPELLKLENPYDHFQREGLEYLWDTTLYDGKYYLYWGPVPAVLGVIISFITSKPVTDAGLVFSFVLGTALFSVLLLRDIYGEYKIPAWVFWGGVLASAVNIPLIWLLTRPTFYEVSIAGGQFFLMAGFFALFRAIHFPVPHKGYLALSALAFGLAGGTRINLLPSVVFLASVILLYIYFDNHRKIRPSMPAFAAVFIPLVLIAGSLFWYNYARFGSIFEFGHRYQLTGPSLTADYGDTSSAAYIVPNIYSYVLRLPVLSREFPFLTIPRIKQNMWPSFIHLPAHYYYTEPLAGILFIVPLIGLTTLLLIRALWLFINGDGSPARSLMVSRSTSLSWFSFSMLGYFVIQMFILLIFINSAVRYLFDVLPVLIVLSVIFVGSYMHMFAQEPYQARLLAFLWILASVLTGLAGLLVGF